jgi:phage-related protein
MSTLIKFFRSATGNEPVREWLKSLEKLDCKSLGDDLQTVQLGWKKGLIREPLVKSLGEGLFELRTRLPSHRISRIFFCVHKEWIVLLHGFIKKTQQTPTQGLALAKKRQKLVKAH